jgi:RNA polymerase sigma-70 factor (ECF subfamily)
MDKNQQNTTFNDWITRHERLIFKVVNAYADHSEDQDDLFQEICIQLFQSIPNFKKKAAVTTWIYRISLNTAIKHLRNVKKHGTKTEINEKIIKTHEIDSVEKDKLDWLYEEIRKMNEIDRSLTLLLLDDLSYREIAEIIGISESNVGVKIHRIKKHLERQTSNFEYHGV